MISIQKNDPVAGVPGLFVYSPSGEYTEVDLVECYREDKPNVPFCAFAAQMVKFGSMVYQQAEPLNENQVAALEVNATMEEVINNEDLVDGKIDPMSLAKNPPSEVLKPTQKKKVQPVEDDFEPVVEELEELENEPVVVPEPEVVPELEVVPEPETPEVIEPVPQVGDTVGESVE